jgi:hypothetical protein
MQAEPACFLKFGAKLTTLLFPHVDDILSFAPSVHRGEMHKILQRFEGKLFGEVKSFIDMHAVRDRAARTIAVDQRSLIHQALVHRSGCDAVGEGGCSLPLGSVPLGSVLPLEAPTHPYRTKSLPCIQKLCGHCSISPP